MKTDPPKMQIALRRRAETTLTIRWVAERLNPGTAKSPNVRIHAARKRQRRKTVCLTRFPFQECGIGHHPESSGSEKPFVGLSRTVMGLFNIPRTLAWVAKALIIIGLAHRDADASGKSTPETTAVYAIVTAVDLYMDTNNGTVPNSWEDLLSVWRFEKANLLLSKYHQQLMVVEETFAILEHGVRSRRFGTNSFIKVVRRMPVRNPDGDWMRSVVIVYGMSATFTWLPESEAQRILANVQLPPPNIEVVEAAKDRIRAEFVEYQKNYREDRSFANRYYLLRNWVYYLVTGSSPPYQPGAGPSRADAVFAAVFALPVLPLILWLAYLRWRRRQ